MPGVEPQPLIPTQRHKVGLGTDGMCGLGTGSELAELFEDLLELHHPTRPSDLLCEVTKLRNNIAPLAGWKI